MGFVIMLFAIVFVLATLIGLGEYATKNDKEAGLGAFVGSGLVASIVAFIVIGMFCITSYCSYLDIEKKRSYIKEYAQTIKSYTDYGVKEFKSTGPNQMPTNELTDLKYNSYQAQLGEMLSDLRYQIREHNKEVTGKVLMNNSWFWNWVIFVPDDSRLIRMEEVLQ